MTRERLDDLLDGLTLRGWLLLDHHDHPRASPDPFVLDDEVLRWALVRGASSPVVELEFYAFGELGQRTDTVNDILYCTANGTAEHLYFCKRARPEWRDRLAHFVRSLDDRSSH